MVGKMALAGGWGNTWGRELVRAACMNYDPICLQSLKWFVHWEVLWLGHYLPVPPGLLRNSEAGGKAMGELMIKSYVMSACIAYMVMFI